MQRCLSIGRRATKPALVTAGVLLSTYELLKQSLMQSGRLEESLSKVTSSKIGIHEGTVNSRSELLKRLKRYRMLFGIVNTSRESQILARLEHAIEDMETDVSTGALRKQPFCVVLYGNPGVGKSSFSIQLAQKLMHGRYGRFTSHDMVTLNETDEYQSEFRTSHKVVLFDDIGAAKSDRPDTTNPWRKVIDFVNNVQKTALNPNCEMKGKVYIQPDLVILTTNLDLSKTFAMVGGFMNCPEAIARRCSSVIHLKDYLTGEIINYDGGSDHSTAYCGKMPTNLKSGLGTIVTRDYIVDELDKRFREHMIDQQKFVDKFNSYFDDLPTIDEIYDEQSEVYELQAAIAPKYDPLHEERITNYLISHIDWDYYFCAYPYGHNEEVYYFDGYIYSSFGKYPNQAIRLHQDYMNELRQKMLDITPDPYRDQEIMDISGLVAEGNSVSIQAESDTCVVSDYLVDAFYDFDDRPIYEVYNDFLQEDHYFVVSDYYVDEDSIVAPMLRSITFEILQILGSPAKTMKFISDHDIKIGAMTLEMIHRGDIGPGSKAIEKILYAASHQLPHRLIPQRVACYFFNYLPFGMSYQLRKKCHDKYSNAADLGCSYRSLLMQFRKDCAISPDIYENPDSFWYVGYATEIEPAQIDVTISDDCSTDTLPESITDDDYYRNLLREKVSNKSGSSDSSQSDCKSQTEQEQCDEFLRIINVPRSSLSRINRNLSFQPYGEIDLVLETEHEILVVEMKRSRETRAMQKAQKQADKYGSMMSILRPDKRVFGITYTYEGIKVRYDNGHPNESNVFDDLFLVIGYTKL